MAIEDRAWPTPPCLAYARCLASRALRGGPETEGCRAFPEWPCSIGAAHSRVVSGCGPREFQRILRRLCRRLRGTHRSALRCHLRVSGKVVEPGRERRTPDQGGGGLFSAHHYADCFSVRAHSRPWLRRGD